MFSTSRLPRLSMVALTVVVAICLARVVRAHEHHDELPPGSYTSPEPIDSILWAHILVQILTWGIIFPTGMVLGITRSKWHVPVQVLGGILAYVGQTLGHKHGGRRFGHNIHATFGPPLGWTLVGQITLGAFLRLHLERRITAFARIRPTFVFLHGLTGKVLPILAWVQFIFGGIVALGFCHDDHMGQCIAHFIMGSAFIAYGIVLTILLLVGQLWLKRTGRSQEFFDSALISAWGCVNTFTEHRWGHPWAHNDLQHTSMGIVWWCAGLVGMWLSRNRDGGAKRNLFPAMVIFLTGWAMSAHPQQLMLSTMVHTVFGWTLMAAGATRAVEISFVLRDKVGVSEGGEETNSFQYLPPFLLYASGFLFMGATEEQMAMLSAAGVSHVSYILILYSIAFLLFLFVNILLHIYAVHAFPPTLPTTTPASSSARNSQPTRQFRDTTSSSIDSPPPFKHEMHDEDDDSIELAANGNGNGHVKGGNTVGGMNGGGGGMNGTISERERRRIRDAQEFELEGLISGDEDDGHVPAARGNGNGMRGGAVML